MVIDLKSKWAQGKLFASVLLKNVTLQNIQILLYTNMQKVNEEFVALVRVKNDTRESTALLINIAYYSCFPLGRNL